MKNQKLRVAVLDDFEQMADTVPAYASLTARAASRWLTSMNPASA